MSDDLLREYRACKVCAAKAAHGFLSWLRDACVHASARCAAFKSPCVESARPQSTFPLLVPFARELKTVKPLVRVYDCPSFYVNDLLVSVAGAHHCNQLTSYLSAEMSSRDLKT